MLPTSSCFTRNEWVALIQQDPQQAKRHAISLRAQIKQLGLMADPALQISLENYERAQELLDKAPNDPQQAEKIARIVAVGQITLSSYPSHNEWLKLLQDDPMLAEGVHLELMTKQALLGLQAPPALQKSIDAYRSVISERQT